MIVIKETWIKIKSTLKKWFDYWCDDYGIDVEVWKASWQAFKNSLAGKIVHWTLVGLLSIVVAVALAGSIMMLLLGYPVSTILYLWFSLMAVVYLLVRDKLDDKYRII